MDDVLSVEVAGEGEKRRENHNSARRTYTHDASTEIRQLWLCGLHVDTSVSPKCQNARGMQGHSNKIKQEFGLTDFPKVRETIF